MTAWRRVRPNFKRMARQRCAEEAPRGILPRTENDRVRRRLLADDKVVVIADGPEEAVLDERLQEGRARHRRPVRVGQRPYPPRGGVPRGGIREPFCRRQQVRAATAGRTRERGARPGRGLVSAARGGRRQLHLDTGVAGVRGVVLRPGLVDALGCLDGLQDEGEDHG
ncbi:hypothetical protein, partial [Streptomyces sp. NRRL WC-3744]|uniref:hypothetical protein n=1 Tax=Streptomyces sp. NRRL WC-3744 TaxID=1463935 RepID=UPI0018FE9538